MFPMIEELVAYSGETDKHPDSEYMTQYDKFHISDEVQRIAWFCFFCFCGDKDGKLTAWSWMWARSLGMGFILALEMKEYSKLKVEAKT